VLSSARCKELSTDAHVSDDAKPSPLLLKEWLLHLASYPKAFIGHSQLNRVDLWSPQQLRIVDMQTHQARIAEFGTPQDLNAEFGWNFTSPQCGVWNCQACTHMCFYFLLSNIPLHSNHRIDINKKTAGCSARQQRSKKT
jgi:hypothetical protein